MSVFTLFFKSNQDNHLGQDFLWQNNYQKAKNRFLHNNSFNNNYSVEGQHKQAWNNIHYYRLGLAAKSSLTSLPWH